MGKPQDGLPAVFLMLISMLLYLCLFHVCTAEGGWEGTSLTFAGIKRNGLGQTFIYPFVITTNILVHVPCGIKAKIP